MWIHSPDPTEHEYNRLECQGKPAKDGLQCGMGIAAAIMWFGGLQVYVLRIPSHPKL